MPRFVAFLRAINVGGGRTVKMASLRQVFKSLGFSGVETFIASGNVVFEATAEKTETLEGKIEKSLREALGYDVATFVRTEAELSEIVDYRPFQQPEVDTAEVNIIFLKDALDEALKQNVTALRTATDEFHVHEREIYWLRRKKQTTSTYSTVPLANALDRPFTIRSAKTVKKIAVKYASTKGAAPPSSVMRQT